MLNPQLTTVKRKGELGTSRLSGPVTGNPSKPLIRPFGFCCCCLPVCLPVLFRCLYFCFYGSVSLSLVLLYLSAHPPLSPLSVYLFACLSVSLCAPLSLLPSPSLCLCLPCLPACLSVSLQHWVGILVMDLIYGYLLMRKTCR